MRYDKLKRNYEGSVALACAFLGYLCETAIAPNGLSVKLDLKITIVVIIKLI